MVASRLLQHLRDIRGARKGKSSWIPRGVGIGVDSAVAIGAAGELGVGLHRRSGPCIIFSNGEGRVTLSSERLACFLRIVVCHVF